MILSVPIHTCTGGAQPLVARACAPVCPSLATPLNGRWVEPGDNCFMEPRFAVPQLGASKCAASLSMHKEMCLCTRLESVFVCSCMWKDREYMRVWEVGWVHTCGCGGCKSVGVCGNSQSL